MINFNNEGSCGPNYSALTVNWSDTEKGLSFQIADGRVSNSVVLRRDAMIYLRDQINKKLEKMPVPKPPYTGSL